MFVDTHLHLADSQFDPDRDAVILQALQAGVVTLVEIAESPESWESAIALAEKYPHIYASLGVHPHHAHEWGPEAWTGLELRLRELLKHPKVVAIGEFGLDYFRMRNTKEQQDFLFRKQLELARDTGKPIVIHCRDAASPPAPLPTGEGGPDAKRSGTGEAERSAQADVQAGLIEFYPETSQARACPEPKGVIHCFSGSWADAQTYMLHGFLLGLDGPVTYPNSTQLKENVTRLPLERIVLETDSPYLPPQAFRGQRNGPPYIPVIAEAVATLKHTTLDQIGRHTTANARALFRIPIASE